MKMSLTWIFGIFILGAVKAAEVCYDRVGCFTDDSPYAGTLVRPITALPWSPEKINTQFFLYTRNNQEQYQVISALDPSSISGSNFSPLRKTRFVIHGFISSGEAAWLSETCRALFQVEDVNCIAVDWNGGASALYTQASNNVRVVGAEIAYFINTLLTDFGYSLSNVHLIGHSLGAHVAGEAGKRMPGISRITGLDPAEPYFQNTPTEVRLDRTDAELVDVIHTDAGPFIPDLGFGMKQVIGHLDFFPNGGVQMPECPQNPESAGADVESVWSGAFDFLTCNHFAAQKYYIESITDPTAFSGYPCADWGTYQQGVCSVCSSSGCPRMGHYADSYTDIKKFSSQVFYLSTV